MTEESLVGLELANVAGNEYIQLFCPFLRIFKATAQARLVEQGNRYKIGQCRRLER
jgi:hypothetical protein